MSERALGVYLEALELLSSQVRGSGAEFSALELELLEAYARERATYLDACDAIEADGLEVIQRDGNGDVVRVIETPKLKIRKDAGESSRRLGRELGLDRVYLPHGTRARRGSQGNKAKGRTRRSE